MAKLAINGADPVRREPWPTWPQHGASVLAAIDRVAKSNCYHPQFGSETENFEKAFAQYMGVAHAVAVASGTLALTACMVAAEVGCGDEVIVPAYTYAASASAAVEQNAVPVFADSEPLSQGIDPEQIRRKITPRTRAIVVVHANGYPCDMDAIMAIAGEHNLTVIEDCSHAHGAQYKGRKVGSIGQLAAFSLQHKKNLSAGTGGVAVTNDDDMALAMRHARNFDWHHIGHNWLISEFSAAIAAAQLPALEANNRQRRQNVATLLAELGDIRGITPLPGHRDTKPAYYNLILQYDEIEIGADRKLFVEALKAEGIPIHMFYVPLQRWPIFAKANFYGHGCPFSCPKQSGEVDYTNISTPVADAICDSVNLEIKVHPVCGETEMKQVAAAIHKILDNIDELKNINNNRTAHKTMEISK